MCSRLISGVPRAFPAAATCWWSPPGRDMMEETRPHSGIPRGLLNKPQLDDPWQFRERKGGLADKITDFLPIPHRKSLRSPLCSTRDRGPQSAVPRDKSREWGRLKAKVEPLLTLGNSGEQRAARAYRRERCTWLFYESKPPWPPCIPQGAGFDLRTCANSASARDCFSPDQGGRPPVP